MIHRHGGSFISTMTETNRWVQMYQHPEPRVRGHAGLPLAERDQVRRRHPAGFHQLRALRPLRVGRGRRLRLQRLQQQPPHLHLPAEVHRAAVGIQARLRDLHAAGRAAWASRTSTPKATASKTGTAWSSTSSDLPKYITYEEFKKKGYFVVPSMPADEEPRVSFRWFYEGRAQRPVLRGQDSPGPPHRRAQLLATPSGQGRVRVLRPSWRSTPMTKSGRPWRATSPAGRATTPRS